MVTWVLGWVAHQLPHAPAHIFDANIFYPERNTLAYSETLLVPGLLAAPLHWLGVGADPDLQPRVPVRLRAVRRRRRAARAPPDRPRRRRDSRRHRLRVSAVSHRSLRAPAAAADAVHPARALGVSSAARHASRLATACCSASSPRARCCRACTTALPHSLHGGRLRRDADRGSRGRCRGRRADRRARRGGRDRGRRHAAGRARLPGGAQGGGRARARRSARRTARPGATTWRRRK